MSIGAKDVRHVARLAELDVAEHELPRLVEQLSGIVDFVSQLNEVDRGEQAAPFVAGPQEAALRDDEVRPAPLAFGVEQLGPETRDGFFLVPRLGQMEDL